MVEISHYIEAMKSRGLAPGTDAYYQEFFRQWHSEGDPTVSYPGGSSNDGGGVYEASVKYWDYYTPAVTEQRQAEEARQAAYWDQRRAENEQAKASFGGTRTSEMIAPTGTLIGKQEIAEKQMLESGTVQWESPEAFAGEAKEFEATTGREGVHAAIPTDKEGNVQFYGVEGAAGYQTSKEANEARLTAINAAAAVRVGTQVQPPPEYDIRPAGLRPQTIDDVLPPQPENVKELSIITGTRYKDYLSAGLIKGTEKLGGRYRGWVAGWYGEPDSTIGKVGKGIIESPATIIESVGHIAGGAEFIAREPKKALGGIPEGFATQYEGVKENPAEFAGTLIGTALIAKGVGKVRGAKVQDVVVKSGPAMAAPIASPKWAVHVPFKESSPLVKAGVKQTIQSIEGSNRNVFVNPTAAAGAGVIIATQQARGAPSPGDYQKAYEVAKDVSAKPEYVNDVIRVTEPRSPAKIETVQNKNAADAYGKKLAAELKAAGVNVEYNKATGAVEKVPDKFDINKGKGKVLDIEYFNKPKETAKGRFKKGFASEDLTGMESISTPADRIKYGGDIVTIPKVTQTPFEEMQSKYAAALAKGSAPISERGVMGVQFGSKGYKPTGQPKQKSTFEEMAEGKYSEALKKGKRGGSIPGLLVVPGYDVPNTRALYVGELKRAVKATVQPKRRPTTTIEDYQIKKPFQMEMMPEAKPKEVVKPRTRTAVKTATRPKAVLLLSTMPQTRTKTTATERAATELETAISPQTNTATRTKTAVKTATETQTRTKPATETQTRTKPATETQTELKTLTKNLTKTLTQTRTATKAPPTTKIKLDLKPTKATGGGVGGKKYREYSNPIIKPLQGFKRPSKKGKKGGR